MRPAICAALLLHTLATLAGAIDNPSSSLQARAVADDHEHPHDADVEMEMASASSAPETPAVAPNPHQHGAHGVAKLILNDTDLHIWHHYPPSYLAADFRLDDDSAIFGEEFDVSWDPDEAHGQRSLMLWHVGAICMAYFGALPITLALRAADHPFHFLANGAFLGTALLGWLAGVWYRAATPNRYEGSVHGGFGNVLLLISISLAILDSLGVIKKAVTFYRSGNRSWAAFVADVLHSSDNSWLGSERHYEMVSLVQTGEDAEDAEPKLHKDFEHVIFAVGDDEDEGEDEHQTSEQAYDGEHTHVRPVFITRQWTPPSRSSTGSGGTLNDPHHSDRHDDSKLSRTGSGAYDASSDPHQQKNVGSIPRKMTARRFGEIVLTWTRRMQIVVAYVVLCTGIPVYTGMCRNSFLPGCAAHIIKGSIFFGYGIMTFARYLGAYADLGWAWNRAPGGHRGPSAEMIECSGIFAYGITNTWMERFGSAPGEPYSVKQVQHISIAVMFWFAGLMGIFLESRTFRRILATVNGRSHPRAEPPSYAFSFNPIPAFVIAVTGLAMAAHFQDYVFQVEVPASWGFLLAGASVFRFLTYFFLWLRPPIESTLPSRPPTEVLAAFGWASGGIMFMLSNEEILFAAMRAGYDDMMAFLNVDIALTSFLFCWTLAILAIKGYAVLRLQNAKHLANGKNDPERAGRL